MIDTKNNKAIFENARVVDNFTLTEDIECEIDASSNEYSDIEHPFYDQDTNKCIGFVDVPDRINCSVNGTLGTNVRRLCNCIDKGKVILGFCFYLF